MTLKYWRDPIGIYPLDHLTLRNSWSGYVARFLNPDPDSDHKMSLSKPIFRLTLYNSYPLSDLGSASDTWFGSPLPCHRKVKIRTPR